MFRFGLGGSGRTVIGAATSNDAFTIALLLGTVAGAVLMLVFPVVFGMSTRPATVAAMALLALTLSSTVYVCWQLMNPLEGFSGATPDGFRSALEDMAAR